MTRLAVSIKTLGDEVLRRSPLTTLYFYDDTVHVDSDHDPNPAGVVCAVDIMAGHGLDLHALSREIVDGRHPDCKYVIYNRQIASRNTNWQWVPYTGKNPHVDHIHVSVGIGPDGYSRQPYDSTEQWLEDFMGDIFCKKGDRNDAVKSLQIGLNRVWPFEPDYNGKDIVKLTGIYDDQTCRAVYTILEGPQAGDLFHPEMYWRLLTKTTQAFGKPGPQGVQGDKGDQGDTATLVDGDLLRVVKP